jgi:hypothetical protein
MKIKAVFRLVGAAWWLPSRRKCVEVLAIQCLGCGRWRGPDEWEPVTGLCLPCTEVYAAHNVAVRRWLRSRRSRRGGAR